MARFTRRGFLKRTAVGIGLAAAGAGVAGGTKALTAALAAPGDGEDSSRAMPRSSLNGTLLAGPMLVHIRDFDTAEIQLLVGTEEITFHDPQLVARLAAAAGANSAAMEG